MTHQRRGHLKLAGAIALSTLLALTACGSDSPDSSNNSSDANGSDPSADTSDELIEIIAGVAPSMSSLNLMLGIEQGFFEEEGLDVSTTPTATGAVGIPGLINDEIQVVLGGTSGSIIAVSEGIEVAIVSGGPSDHESEEGPWYGTLVDPDSGIESFKDLEGKTVALNSLNCCWEFWTKEAVEQDGGDSSALEIVQLPFAQQATALASGQVDAITTQQPFLKEAELDGFVSLGNPAAIAYDNPENVNTNYVMALSFIEEHPDVVERWRNALAKSNEYANSNPDKVREAAVEVASLDEDLVEAAPVPFFNHELDLDAIEDEAGWLVKYGVIPEAPSIDELVAP